MKLVGVGWLLALAAAACSGGGGEPSGPGTGAVTFTPETGALDNGVLLTMKGFTEETVTFDVVLQNSSQPVIGAAVEVGYDPANLSSLGGSAGPFLSGSSTVSRAVVAGDGPGKLVAVFTQADLFRGNVGTGTLGSFTMKLEPGGYTTALTVNGSASTLFGPGGIPLTGETFAGGTLNVRRSGG